MRVGIITTSYPRVPGDPAGHFVAAHARALRALGHSVEVIAAGLDGATTDPPDADGIRVHRIDGRGLFDHGGAPDHLERTRRALVPAVRFTVRLAAAVQRHGRHWDSIVAHWLAPCALVALPTRAPLFAIAHGGDVHTLHRLRLLGIALHALHRRGAQLAFVATELRELARRAAPRLHAWLAGCPVQPMGLDLARFAALPRRPTHPPVIAIAARLVPLKGVDLAIAALAHVRRPVRLVIAGDGPERDALAAQATRITHHHVELLGAITTSARDQLLARASLVLVPSRVAPSGRTEGTPLIALEALAAGVPVIACAVGGLRDLAAAITLVEPDPRALAAAITCALAGPPPTPATLRGHVSHLDWTRIAPRLIAAAPAGFPAK